MTNFKKHLTLAATASIAWFAAHASAAGLLIADGGLGGKLVIKQQEVKVAINNGVAVTTVDQVFQNSESRAVEALYTFPVRRARAFRTSACGSTAKRWSAK